MSKNCVMCNKKIGLFEKMYEDKYCKECYEIMQNEKEKERKKEEERKRKENLLKKLKEQEEEKRKQKEKIDTARDYLLYTNYYWVVIGNISLIPFHYEDIFNNSVTNKFEIIQLLLNEIIKELPKDFSFNDIKQITTYRKSSKIIHDVLKNYTNANLDYLKYCQILVEDQQYAPNPNYNILDDIDENSYLLDNETVLLNFNNIIQSFIDEREKTINYLQKIINESIDDSKRPNKYDTDKCIKFYKEEELKQTFEILEIYYFYAVIIVYYIHYNIIVDKIMDNSELYNIYKKIKNEIHNENYIIQKLYPIYNSLYKNEYDITFDDENEIKLLIETINDKEKIVEKDDFIDINSSILNINININKFVNSTNDDELAFKVLDEINSNIISYKKYLSINDVLDILIYSRKYIDIINEVKKQQALKEKERILNGCFEEEKEINNNLLDYSNITNGYDFEAFVANVYKMLGYNVEGVTSKSGDQGADVIIEKDNIKYAIQVKYYNNPVGNKAVQEIVAAKSFYKTDKAMVVTNSTFTPQAITLANANDVLLVDGNKLDKLINQVKNNN